MSPGFSQKHSAVAGMEHIISAGRRNSGETQVAGGGEVNKKEVNRWRGPSGREGR